MASQPVQNTSAWRESRCSLLVADKLKVGKEFRGFVCKKETGCASAYVDYTESARLRVELVAEGVRLGLGGHDDGLSGLSRVNRHSMRMQCRTLTKDLCFAAPKVDC